MTSWDSEFYNTTLHCEEAPSFCLITNELGQIRLLTETYAHSGLRTSDAELNWDHYAFLMVCVPSECGALRKDELWGSHIDFWMLYPVTHLFFLFTFLLSPFPFSPFPIILASRHWDIILFPFKFWKIWSSHKNNAWKAMFLQRVLKRKKMWKRYRTGLLFFLKKIS